MCVEFMLSACLPTDFRKHDTPPHSASLATQATPSLAAGRQGR